MATVPRAPLWTRVAPRDQTAALGANDGAWQNPIAIHTTPPFPLPLGVPDLQVPRAYSRAYYEQTAANMALLAGVAPAPVPSLVWPNPRPMAFQPPDTSGSALTTRPAAPPPVVVETAVVRRPAPLVLDTPPTPLTVLSPAVAGPPQAADTAVVRARAALPADAQGAPLTTLSPAVAPSPRPVDTTQVRGRSTQPPEQAPAPLVVLNPPASQPPAPAITPNPAWRATPQPEIVPALTFRAAPPSITFQHADWPLPARRNAVIEGQPQRGLGLISTAVPPPRALDWAIVRPAPRVTESSFGPTLNFRKPGQKPFNQTDWQLPIRPRWQYADVGSFGKVHIPEPVSLTFAVLAFTTNEPVDVYAVIVNTAVAVLGGVADTLPIEGFLTSGRVDTTGLMSNTPVAVAAGF